MGNIVASAKSAPPLDLLTSVPELDIGSKLEESPSKDEIVSSSNPGSFEELPRKVSSTYKYNFSWLKNGFTIEKLTYIHNPN